MLNKIIFAAGGTGGHIYPAIAVADELKKKNSRISICFVGAKGKMEEKIIPAQGYEFKSVNITGFERRINPKNLFTLLNLFTSLRQARSILETFGPDLVFGTGGYVSGPVLLAAKKLNIPSIVYEGNYHPGLTVRLLASSVNKILLNFQESDKFFKQKNKIAVMPYPVRKNLKHYPLNEAVKYFGFKPGKKNIFIFGGSQGAHSVNQTLLKCFQSLTDSGINILWQTGDRDFDSINQAVKNENVKLFKFLNEIDIAYSASDLVICRAGISTIMEIAYFGAAAIFVPYPYASDNHQVKNAERLCQSNAAEMILDKDIEQMLAPKIMEIIHDNNRLELMRKNIRRFSDDNAASKIADFLNTFSG